MAAADPSTFDPILATEDGATTMIVMHLSGRLVRTGKDGRSVEPDLAESWDVSADGRVYTFHLRPDLKFSDGSPLRPSDVKFSIERAAKDPLSTQRPLYPPQFEISTPDDRTVVLTLPGPHASLLAVLALVSGCIVPEAHFKQVGPQGFVEAPVGAGPFLLAEWKRQDRVVLRRNPHYWDPHHPYLDEVRMLVLQDEMTEVLKLQAGEVDMAWVPANQVETLRRAPNVSVQVMPMFNLGYLRLNRRRPELNDAKVRQALYWAVDRKALVQTVLFGMGEVPTSYMPRVLYSGTEPLGHDPAKARELLSESAYPSGFSGRLLIRSDEIFRHTAVAVQSQLGALGIRLEIRQVEPAQHFDAMRKGDWDMSVNIVSADSFDPVEWTLWNVVSTGFGATAAGYKNEEVDTLATKAQAENDPIQRAALYRTLEKVVRDDGPYVPLLIPSAVIATRQDVFDFTLLPNTDTYRLWDVWKSP
jgi:peptide/nickel transport system substrate-binding protein